MKIFKTGKEQVYSVTVCRMYRGFTMTPGKLLFVILLLCQHVVAGEPVTMTDSFRQLMSVSGIDSAIEYYRKSPASFSGDRQQLNDLGYEMLDQQAAGAALKIFQLNIDLFPNAWQNRKSLGQAHYALQNYQLALDNYQLALDMLETSTPESDKRAGLIRKIARTHRKLGNYYAALYVFQLEVARDPTADWAVQKIGQWMLKYGHPNVGIRWLKRATDMQGSPDRAWQKLGNYLAKGSSYRYIRYLREGRNRFPYLAASWDRLAAALLDDYRFREAERVIAEALKLFQASSLWRTAGFQQGRAMLGHYEIDLQGEQFTAMGCGPYYAEDEVALKHYMKIENAISSSEFLIHLGDIGKGIDEVPESRYANVAGILNQLNRKPTFVVLGDNDWNDTVDPAKSLDYWKRHLGDFHRHFKLPFTVETQPIRKENFSFVLGDVMYIGINLPEGLVHDALEWQTRISENGVWIEYNLATTQAKAAVIMAHAPADVFDGLLLESLTRSATRFARPVLYLNANGHQWFYRKGEWADNITQVQLDKIYDEKPGYPPVQVRYTGRDDLPFVFDRRIASPIWQIRK